MGFHSSASLPSAWMSSGLAVAGAWADARDSPRAAGAGSTKPATGPAAALGAAGLAALISIDAPPPCLPLSLLPPLDATAVAAAASLLPLAAAVAAAVAAPGS